MPNRQQLRRSAGEIVLVDEVCDQTMPGAERATNANRPLNERAADVLAVLRDSVRDRIFPGAVAALISRMDEIYVPFGHETYDPGARAITDDAIFDIASLTKIVATATAVMQLVERKQLALDDRACDVLPRLRQAPKDRITIAQLLAHTAGFPGGEPLRHYQTRDDRVNAIYSMDLAYAPGTDRVYDDLGYILLGLIVEAVTGVAFGTYCENEILGPLGMRETMFVPPTTLLPRIVPTEIDPERGGLLRGVVHDGTAHKLGGVAGHAGLFSTARDLGWFCRAMMGHAEGALGGVLSSASVQRMWAPQWQDHEGEYALGWDRLRPSYMNGLDDRDAVGHTGFTGVSLVISPRRDLAMILLSNRVHPVRSDRTQIGLARRRFVEAALRHCLAATERG
jgi:CubicO group peptidase (beta-lactamase class C family)